MKKLILLFVLLIVFTTGCSRTFVVTNSDKFETNYLKVSDYNDQGIEIKKTNNWTLGNTGGINSHVYLDEKLRANDKVAGLEPDLIVNFPFNSVAMHPESIAKLATLFGKLDKAYSINLVGFTDDVGSEYINFVLSNKRALAVKEFILEHKKLTIETEGKGLNLPIANNETEAGRQLNRRVEVYINE